MKKRKQPNHSQMPQVRRLRKRTGASEGTGEDLWAVSYSDLLMVMMSFFIVFFNLETEQEKHTPINRLALEMKEKLNAQVVDRESGFPVVNSTLNKVTEGEKVLGGFLLKDGQLSSYEKVEETENVENAEIKISFEKDSTRSPSSQAQNSIYVDFSHNMFKLGSYELNQKGKQQIRKVLDIIKRNKDQYQVIFVGHSDSTPMSQSRKVVKTNLILSTLRAAKAVEFSIGEGLRPSLLSAQGVDEYSRNSRSISMKILRI